MLLIKSTDEQAKFTDILRHFEREQKSQPNLQDEILTIQKSRRSGEQFWNLLIGLLTVFTSSFLR